jgi:cardiolipin synthase
MLTRLPNALTFSRILAIPVVAALLFLGTPHADWIALAIYVYACVTDFLDGYLARAWHQQSAFGRFLDPIADKLLVAAVVIALVGMDRIAGLAVLPAAVILCREILVSGLREFLAEVRVSVPVSRLAKWKTGLQMVALAFLIVGDAGTAAGAAFGAVGISGLWVAALLTLITGYDYLRSGLRHIRETDSAPAPRPRPRPRPKPFKVAKGAKPLRDAG